MFRSVLFAFVLAVGVGVWIASGYFLTDEPVAADIKKPGAVLSPEIKAPTVRTRNLRIGTFADRLRLSATTALDSRVKISAQSGGRIEQVLFEKGDEVKVGQLLATIELDTQDTNLLQAEAALGQAQADYNSTKKLADRGFASSNALLQKEATLKQAEAAVNQATKASEKLEITATTDGRVENRMIEPGQFINVGASIADVVKADKIKFVAEASERDIAKISLGSPAKAKTISGNEYDGEISYIAAIANNATRTFTIEVTAPNLDGKAIEGMTASLEFDLESKEAHLIPNSLLSLNESGNIGIKTVEADKVTFYEVDLLNATNAGIWIEGLPDTIQLITVGQEFVKAGQTVKTKDEDELNAEVKAAEEALKEKDQ